ncbi:MAG: PAC2 family protein [SAR202 cluster bacterium]|nr:PAC2 family protein [SAR202 cluster bacterium]
MKVGAFELTEPVPELRNTRAFAMLKPWIDVGRVGTLALNRMERHLGAKELGKLARPGRYFDFTRYRPYLGYVGGKRVMTIPNTVVNHATDPDGNGYLFLHIREPHAFGEEYCESVTELLKHFNVSEYCRIGGFYDSVPHTRPVIISATLSGEQVERAHGLVSPRPNTYQGPTSIINMVADQLSESEVRVASVMAHLPQYARLDEDEMGTARIMEVLCAVYDFPASLADTTAGQRQYADIGRAVESNPEVKALISQLEVYYDKTQVVPDPTETPKLSPELERFLKEVSKGLTNPEE